MKYTVVQKMCIRDRYGEASGTAREAGMLRSQYADITTPTEVELTFEYKGRQYVLRRNPEYTLSLIHI